MASKIFDTQEWRLICDTKEDQTNVTTKQILARSPLGPISTFAATLDTNDNRIYYDVQVNEMTDVGDWKVWPKTTIDSVIAPGDPAIVTIHAEGT